MQYCIYYNVYEVMVVPFKKMCCHSNRQTEVTIKVKILFHVYARKFEH